MAIEAVARQVEEFAPAKVNLTLHVTGQRRDGYHLLDSLVVFADVGDVIRARSGPGLSLRISGPRGAGLSSGEDNLVLRAARSLGQAAGAELQLEKHLPVASGIGGGSADAAATLRALSRLWRCPLPADRGLSLGADVPVCVDRKAVRMTGVGEGLAALRSLPDGWLVLVNPGVPVSTPAVFRAMHRRDLAPMPRDLPGFASLTEFAVFLRMQRNDMQAAATMIAPVIAEVEAALSVQPGCLMARMSGSGATCFGLFADPLSAAGAARAIQAARPDWWAAAGRMMG